jgi:hypothetical protein
VFTDIHRRGLFGGSESRSGPGSGLARTERLRAELPRLLAELETRVLLDAACGDCLWMSRVALGDVSYVGIDVVPELVALNEERYGGPGRRFAVADITSDQLPRADVVLSRDCFIHFPDKDIWRALANIRHSGATYLVATTFREIPNRPIRRLGYSWRALNLEAPPFCLPPPERTLEDAPAGSRFDKRLGVWRCGDLPDARRAA